MAKRKSGVTVSDLRPGQAYGFLYCDVCGQECSADAGDYWNLPADYVFACDHGASEGSVEDNLFGDVLPVNMRLVRRETRLVGVR
jgi:hypothetical protein